MRVINLSTVSTKKEEPKKKETAAAILSILSVQPQGLTPHFGEEEGIEEAKSDRASDPEEDKAKSSRSVVEVIDKTDPAVDRASQERRAERFDS